MNDDTHPIGGSAWEPAPAPVPDTREPAPSGPATSEPAAMAAGPGPRVARWRPRFTGSSNRRRGSLAGAALGLVVVSGLGGFALGHAAADEGAGFADRGQVGSPFGQDVDGDGDHGLPGGPPRGTPGYLPGQPPGDLDGDGTGGDDGGSDSDPDSGTTEPGSQT